MWYVIRFIKDSAGVAQAAHSALHKRPELGSFRDFARRPKLASFCQFGGRHAPAREIGFVR